MAGWNGSGIFTRTYNWVQDATNGIKIRADRHDQNDIDFVNGINNCLTKDGQNSPSVNLPMANNKHTAVANATARDEYLAMGQFQDNSGKYYVTTNISNAYSIAAVPSLTTYTAGQSFLIKINATNTGAATLNVNSVGAIAITKNGATALASGDLVLDKIYQVVYDGTQFQIQDTASTADPVFNEVTTATVIATTSLETPLVIDSNGNQVLTFTENASAVNQVDIENAATGTNPTISAQGDDINISLDFQSKGTGSYNFLATADQASEIRLYEDTDNGTNYIGLQAPTAITSDVTFTLPDADGSSGEILTTDGAGNLSFTSAATGVTQYSGATVFNQAVVVTSWEDIDLSTEVGTNRALVTLSVTITADADIMFRTNGETRTIGANGFSTFGSGTSSGRLDSVSVDYYQLLTDVNGVIEYNVDATTGTPTMVVELLTYTVL